jgi:hypothetical protein
MDRGPVFVVGVERSGTSLIYALLASHPSLAMTRRTNLWTHFYNQYGDLSRAENFERCLAAMLRYKRVLRLEPDPERVRREFWQGEPTYARLFSLLEEHFAERQGKSRWGDKSLNTERYADPIFTGYPNARILHMIRDPRDRYASALTRWKVSRGGTGAGTALWLSSVNLARRNEERYPNQYMIVRYESLVEQPEAKLREICAFVGEEYDPAMLTMKGAQVLLDKGGNSSYGRREPGRISIGSVGRFRQVLNARQIAFTQMVAGGEMRAFDYPLVETRLSPRDWLLYGLLDLPLNLARMLAWMGREAYLNRVGRAVPSYRIVSQPRAELG